MQAIVYDSYQGPLAIRDVPDPLVAADGVIIDVRASGLCRSDWHGWMGHDPDVKLPHVPGHELAGVVSEVGANVLRFRVGDRVTVPFCVGCGQCSPCREGQLHICDDYFQPGFTAWGSFADRVAIPHADLNLVHLPDELPFVDAASLGCRFVTSFRALVHQAQLRADQWLAVHGCGGVGLAAIMIGRAVGARIVAIDVNPDALDWAKELGAEATLQASLDPKAGRDLVRQLKETTGGGAHVSIDAVGGQASCLQSFYSLRKQGCHVQVGLMVGDERTAPIPMFQVIAKELKLVGSHGMAAADYPQLLDWIVTGRLQPSRLVADRVSMESIAEKLPRMAENRHAGMTVMER